MVAKKLTINQLNKLAKESEIECKNCKFWVSLRGIDIYDHHTTGKQTIVKKDGPKACGIFHSSQIGYCSQFSKFKSK